MEENQEPPIVNMVSSDTQTIGILAVSKSGHITYWRQYSDTSSFLKYKLSLSQQEQITAVESIRGQRAILGSSLGNIYLVDYNANKLAVFSFYKQMNLATFLSNMLFVTNPVESRSNVVKSSLPCKGKILRIRFSQDHAYIAYAEHMAVWNINDQNEIRVRIPNWRRRMIYSNCIYLAVDRDINSSSFKRSFITTYSFSCIKRLYQSQLVGHLLI